MICSSSCFWLEHLIEGIVVCDDSLCIKEINKTFLNFTGFDKNEVLNKRITNLIDERYLSKFYKALDNTEESLTEIYVLKKDGKHAWMAMRALKTEDGYVLMCIDISEIKKHEQRLYTLQNYDILTKLPNRRFFLDFIKLKIEEYERQGYFGALLFIDIDNFTIINDLYGYKIGDKVLNIIAKRLKKGVRRHDFVARIGGDEFLVFLDLKASTYEEAMRMARNISYQIQKKIEKKVYIGSLKISLTVSIGIAIVDGNMDIDNMMRQADLALLNARQGRNSQITLFDEVSQEELEKKLLLYEQIQEGLEREEFYILFQPKVSLKDESIVGFEALLRWKHKEQIVSPMEFIPIAEESGIIVELSKFVLNECCKLLKDGVLNQVSINISPLWFEEECFVQEIKDIIHSYAVNPNDIIFEITENLLIEDMQAALEKMRVLREFGIRFSIDDFGTGFSSFAYLKKLPIYELKIDRVFIKDMLKSQNDRSIVEAIVQITKIYNYVTTAEGVENKEEVEFLKKIGVEYVQGYYYYPPLTIDKVRSLNAFFKKR